MVVQVVKEYSKTSGWKTLGVLLAVSLVGGAMYVYLIDAGYWMTVLRVITSAAGIYSLFTAVNK